jgi:hypothetical protein
MAAHLQRDRARFLLPHANQAEILRREEALPTSHSGEFADACRILNQRVKKLLYNLK